MRLARGNRLGPYEVLSTLGTGGMAEVYRARDTRLGRDIALKVVNEALAADPELVRRFEQEARLAGSLNHPNLVAVYDVGLHEGAPYFVTELLKGESLRQRLSRGRLPVDTALDWGAQLAEGLAAAHARGIVHRDVKPDNVFVTSDGHVKLLDFGIAKLVEESRPAGPHGLLEDTVTPAGGETRTGAILGTPAYMSPEQVQGEAVDARTDIFSLGTVLYEMLSGRRPFPGSTLVESGHAILHDEPPPLENVPPPLAQLVRRCLAKEPEARLQSARDLAFALEMLRADFGPRRASRQAGLRGLARRSWWVLVLLGSAGVALAVSRLLPSPTTVPPASERVTFRPINFLPPARFTRDGRIVFSTRNGAVQEIYERNLASPSIHPLGMENVFLAAVSPTNECAVFRGLAPTNLWNLARTLARVACGGGTPQTIGENVWSADWSPSGALAVVRQIGKRFAVEYPIGKTLFEVTEPEWIVDLRVSPHGDRLAFIHHPRSDYSGEAMVIDLDGKKRGVSRNWHRIIGLAWAPGEELWYSAGDGMPDRIQAMPFRGPERQVYGAQNLTILEDISADGRVLVGQGFWERDITFLGDGAPNPRSLAWNDLDLWPRLSRDGRLALFSAWDPRSEMVAMLRGTNGAAPQALGEGGGSDLSPDGRTALLLSDAGQALTVMATDGDSRRTIRPRGLAFREARFAGGTDRAIATARAGSDKGSRIYSVDLRSEAVAPASEEGIDERSLEVSPGAGWAATRTTVEGKMVPVIVPLSGGSPSTLSDLGPDLKPVSWASDDELWLTRIDQGDPTKFELIRYDVRRRLVLKKRTIGSGGGTVLSVHVTPDGKNVVFGEERVAGHLYVVRGLTGAH